MSDAPITLFIPFGNGYGNPGITVRADSLRELNTILDEFSSQDDPEGTSLLDQILDGVVTVKAGVLLKFPQEAPVAKPVTHPQAQNSPADAPNCTHGAMKYREGKVKSGPNVGKDYKGWFCPAPQGTNQCKPQFINK